MGHYEHSFDNQARRAPLADAYWRLIGGRPGMRVADVGTGAGWFALRYAALTGPAGHVHAVDADADALAFLRARLDPVHHAHVTLEQLDVERAPLPDLHFHALFVTDMLHHADPARVLRNLRASRAPALIAEFDPEGEGEMGPPRDMRIGAETVIAALRETGWTAGPVEMLPFEHWALVARPA